MVSPPKKMGMRYQLFSLKQSLRPLKMAVKMDTPIKVDALRPDKLSSINILTKIFHSRPMTFILLMVVMVLYKQVLL